MRNSVAKALRLAYFSMTALVFFASFEVSASTLPHQDIYGLSQFSVNQGSTNLPPATQIESGTMAINKSTMTLILHIERNYYCPPNSICTEQMPEPLVIELPITYIGSGFCGGEVISAETDSRSTDGHYLGVHFTNDEGNFCTQPEKDDRRIPKPVTIQFAEQSSIETEPRLSQFRGQLIR